MTRLLCPSIMCADFDNLGNEIKMLDEAGIDIFHCDVMDGTFVPNFAMGLQDIEIVRKNTKKLVDVHLMVENPYDKVDLFIERGVDIIYIHPETDRSPSKTLNYLKSKNIGAGLALNPSTNIQTILPYVSLCDYLMIMTVEPGFAGQSYLEFVNEKIVELASYKEKNSFKILVDGAISPTKVNELSKLGVDGFVLGTSALFNKEESYKELVEGLRKES